MTDYTIISKFRNKAECERLAGMLKAKGKTCHRFWDAPADPENPDANAESQMEQFESTKDFFSNAYFQHLFEKDLMGMQEAKEVIMLLPAGNSTHIEAGIAYGLGKPLILIGKPEKPESLYLIFAKRFDSIENFIASLVS